MALVLADRVKETTTTTGTGTITLAGASIGYQSFSVVGNGNITYYTIAGQGTSEWEIGIGTYTSSGTTLSRDTVLASSAGAPTKTTFSAGIKDVFVTYTATRSVTVDGSTVDTFGLGAAQGDILYASATDNFARLAKSSTATRYLANTGTSNNPQWDQVNLSNGITGTLPIGNGGTGQTTANAALNALIPSQTSNSGKFLTTDGSNTSWGNVFPSGTALLFAQTSAPVGWTKSTTHNDKALRVVSGTAGSGGSVAFSTAFASKSVSGTVGGTTLTTSQIPGHTHAVTMLGFAGDLGLQPQQSGGDGGRYGFVDQPEGTAENGSPGGTTSATYARSTGGGSSHDHSFSGTAINMAVQYVDVIIATKD
jgi:hypothetical protein